MQKVYQYRKRDSLLKALIVIALFLLVTRYLKDFNTGWVKFIFSGIIGKLLLEATGLFYFFNRSMLVEDQHILIKKWMGTSMKIPFTKLKRVILKREIDRWGRNRSKLVLSQGIRKNEISLVNLEEELKFIHLMKSKADQFQFKFMEEIGEDQENKLLSQIKALR